MDGRFCNRFFFSYCEWWDAIPFAPIISISFTVCTVGDAS